MILLKKFPLLSLVLLLSQALYGQTYADLMTDASRKIESEHFKEAFALFEKAFEETAEIGKYDYANAAVVAIKCHEFETALLWLRSGLELGLGADEDELQYFKNDEVFEPIRHDQNFVMLIVSMEENLVKARQNDIRRDSIWRETILANRIGISDQSPAAHSPIPKGFALYELGESYGAMPYLVYFPRSVSNIESVKQLVVFLHGGVSSKKAYNPFDVSIRSETIFDIADSLDFVVIYPIGKKDFGWKNQPAAFDAIHEIVADVNQRYHIKNQEIFLGGMSEGGTAAFWFAQKAESAFKAFFTLSALPKLPDFASAHESFCPKHALYSIHAIDDSTYPFESVTEAYHRCDKALHWRLTTVPSGGHGFPYLDGSKEILIPFFKQFLSSTD